jgi:predicted Zn-dependent protease
MHRRHLLLAFPVCLTARAQNFDLPLASPADAVNVYIIPTDGISVDTVGELARALSKATGLWIKATMWTPSDGIEPFAGTNQYPAEDYFPLGARVGRMLREVSPRTYYIVLTDRDLNSKSRNFRFQYSSHSPMANTSVLSIARLLYTNIGTPATNDVVGSRVAKMLLRIVGEMRMGWKRTSDPADLMYAPIMSMDDVDRMDLTYSLQNHKLAQ